MALVTCKDCGGALSTEAKACPNCGKPVGGKKRKVQLYILGFLTGLLVLMIVLVAIGEKNSPTSNASNAPRVLVGDNMTKESWQVKVDGAQACESKDVLSKLIGFVVAKDEQAYRSYLREHLGLGDCWLMEKGTKVFLEDASLFGNPCVRRRGDTTCGYVSRSLLEPARE